MTVRPGFPIRLIFCLASIVLICVSVSAQIPEIVEPVTTAFGTYYPYPVVVDPDASQYEVQPELSNIENRSTFLLSAGSEALLEEQGFFIAMGRDNVYADVSFSGSAYRNFEDVYLEAQQSGVPSYVTTDTMLHVFHRLFDYTLKTTEENFLFDLALDLDTRLLDRLASIYELASTSEIRESARLAATYMAVGLKLLDSEAEVPAWVEPDLSAELELIMAAETPLWCPLFNAYVEDYTQYIPRGHYTRSERLKKYFRAMMWHGRMTFGIRNLVFGEPDIQRPDLTRAALLLARELILVENGVSLEQTWHLVYDPTEFFVGQSDDLQFEDYLALAELVYGAPLIDVSIDTICETDMIQNFMDRAEVELPQPRIRGNSPQGMRLFGQRFLPDSWYLSELVWNKVGTIDRPRLMPSVLDVMSVLGSEEALRLQRETGAESYENYIAQLEFLRSDVSNGPVERWAATLYWNWIYTMAPLLREWGSAFPPYMQSDAWSRRQLMCAAGTWTELRHDTILYVKGSNSSPWSSGPDSMLLVQGAVEPNPWVFARLAALAAYARIGLGGLAILDPEVETKLADLEQASILMTDAAIRELESRPLTNEQHRFIFGFGKWLGVILALNEVEDPGPADDNDRSPVVADVHTDGNTGRALEEGTGYAGRLFVVADVEGQLQLCVGAAFIPFEFTVPTSDRLTDETWWEMLEDGEPNVPWWTEPVLESTVVSEADAQDAAAEYVLWEPLVELETHEVERGQYLKLSCEPQASLVTVRAQGGIERTIEVDVSIGEPVLIATDGLPTGEITVIASWYNGATYSLRASVLPRIVAPRRGSTRQRIGVP